MKAMEDTTVITRTDRRVRRDVKQPRLWNVVLLDDDDHTYEYVIEMMIKLFGHPIEQAVEIAHTVDAHGRAVCCTTHRERAELKVEQISGFGADPRISSCAGPMSSYIEPADGGDADDDDG